jgi:hypothetical protein
LGGAPGVAHLTVSDRAHAAHKEADDLGHDEGDEEYDNQPGQVVMDEVNEVRVPVSFEDVKDAFIVRRGGVEV